MKTAGLFFFLTLFSASIGTLSDEFRDFLKFIPLDKIRLIAQSHAENDAEFADVVRYLQGPQWAELVKAVRSKPEWQNVERYMAEAGLELQPIIVKIHNFIATLKPGTNPGKELNMRAFLDEVEKVVACDEILVAIDEKLEKGGDFKNFYDIISSPRIKQLVEEIRALPEVQRLVKRLAEMGIRVQEFLITVYKLFEWGSLSK